ncbi:MAG: type I-MYXAN CRISPR-associated Cas8a1/Cmx1 [Planctomycetes bacterium]|nr:type I-MYXAN CRISPR-associated Cas8a1/Cmx1 [Planctomycetota bacterium]
MAKVMKPKSTKRAKAATGPDHLTMRLFAPGMTALHRAGLGGLACTLKYIERAYQQGALDDDEVPGGPWVDGKPPWEIEADQVTLRFGKLELAHEYLKQLFALGFRLNEHDELINLPGQYRITLNAAVRADLQLGLTLTFLQHGKTRTLAKAPTTASHDPDGDGIPSVVVEYRRCSGYKHQKGWEDCVNPKTGCLSTSTVGIEGPLNPGAVVRHNAFAAPTKIEEPVERLLPLYFALIGCVSLAVNRGVGVLLIPEVDDLQSFAIARPLMTPISGKQSIAAGAADVGLQLQVRMKAAHLGLAACHAVTLRSTPWASQQKSRVESLYIPVMRGRDLDVYELALAQLRPRVATRVVKESIGKGKAKVTKERREAFRTDSVVRPFIAQNLARGRRWYDRFSRLMIAINPATDKPYRNHISFEREGLHAMVTDDRAWDDDAEGLVVRAVHEAISYRLGQIRKETDGDNTRISPATKNRWDKFRERLRLELAGAKTQGQVRFALCNLFSRAGRLPSLQDGWKLLLPMFRESRWQHTRDLALLAFASYGGKETESDDSSPQPN